MGFNRPFFPVPNFSGRRSPPLFSDSPSEHFHNCMGTRRPGIKTDCTSGGVGMNKIPESAGIMISSLYTKRPICRNNPTFSVLKHRRETIPGKRNQNQYEFQGPCIGCPRIVPAPCPGCLPLWTDARWPRAGGGIIMPFVVYEIDLVTGKIENPTLFRLKKRQGNTLPIWSKDGGKGPTG